ncbi:MAG TPA: methyltransferase [Pyrinomonadaceae bacterium]|nr:methyltransferase [Pyrinomonadaceae bacterium]
MKNPLKKKIEPENVQTLLELMTAYQRSQVLFTFVELKIADLLKRDHFSAKEIARRKKIDPLAMERFLNAAVGIGLLNRAKDIYSNSPLAKNFLVNGEEFYLGGQAGRHQNRSLDAWKDLTKHLKNWKYGTNKKENPDETDQGAEAMTEQHNLALLQGFALAEAFDFSKYRKLLDLGGGTGATSIALCKSFSQLESVVYDLPENVKIAEKFIKEGGLNKRIETIGGDLKNDELPEEFDAVLLANFMSVADAADNKKLLQRIYEKLPSGGVCILSGWIIDNSHLAPLVSVLFCLEDICWNAPDVERDEKIYTDWLKEAGFVKIECETYFEPTKILYGFKP